MVNHLVSTLQIKYVVMLLIYVFFIVIQIFRVTLNNSVQKNVMFLEYY